MRFSKTFLAVALLMVVGSTASALDAIDGEYRPNCYRSLPSALDGIDGEYRPNQYGSSPNALDGIDGEFVPNLCDGLPYADGGLTPFWLDELDCLLGF